MKDGQITGIWLYCNSNCQNADFTKVFCPFDTLHIFLFGYWMIGGNNCHFYITGIMSNINRDIRFRNDKKLKTSETQALKWYGTDLDDAAFIELSVA